MQRVLNWDHRHFFGGRNVLLQICIGWGRDQLRINSRIFFCPISRFNSCGVFDIIYKLEKNRFLEADRLIFIPYPNHSTASLNWMAFITWMYFILFLPQFFANASKFYGEDFLLFKEVLLFIYFLFVIQIVFYSILCS